MYYTATNIKMRSSKEYRNTILKIINEWSIFAKVTICKVIYVCMEKNIYIYKKLLTSFLVFRLKKKSTFRNVKHLLFKLKVYNEKSQDEKQIIFTYLNFLFIKF